MNERIVRIDSFLKKLSNYPGRLSIKAIINELRLLDIPKDKQGQVTGIHEELKKEYENSQNTSIYKYNAQADYCYAVNLYQGNIRWDKISRLATKKGSQEKISSTNFDPIKIYLNLDKEHISKGAKIILDYLSNEDIEHITNIANSVRTDGIIIKVFNEKDAEKVINFINTNSYLNESPLKPNPFLMTSGIVGLAQDNFNTYYNVLATLIMAYLNECKRQEDKIPGFEGFKNFVSEFDLEKAGLREIDLRYVAEVKNLIMINLTSNNLEDFYRHFHSVKGNEDAIYQEEKDQSIISIIIKAYAATKNSHGEENAKSNMIEFLKTDDAAYITRENESGEQIRETIRRIHNEACIDELLRYTRSNNIEDAVNVLASMEKYNGILETLQVEFNKKYEEKGPEEAIRTFKLAMEKYSKEKEDDGSPSKTKLDEAIKMYIRFNNLQLVDNDPQKTIILDFERRASLNKLEKKRNK